MSYKLTTAELIDRLSIVIMKIAHGAKVEEELKLLVEEINDKEGAIMMGEFIYATVSLALVNAFIWMNEDAARTEAEQNPLMLLKSHRLNADRAYAKKRINNLLGERIDPKLNYVNGEWNLKYE